MCAVIGAHLKLVSSEDITLLENIFLESGIRGLHATGVSYIKDNKIITIKESLPSYEFLKRYKISDMVNEDGNLYLIGHCRYSTSDLEYNQPFNSFDVSIVHNGVITQELPEKWKDLYGYYTFTKNDSELILRTIENGEDPLDIWANSSIAAIELHLNKNIVYYRNGKRPIYHSKVHNGVIITSTADIMKRASGDSIIAEELNKDLKIEYNGEVFTETQTLTDSQDLQHV